MRSDGIELFKSACREIGVPVMDLIVRTARWIDPAVVAVLPVWYPAFYRGMPLLKADWKTPQLHKKKEQKPETNHRALWTLNAALGGKGTNWTCCHIWGYSDPTFQEAGGLTRNPSYYTCVPNMVRLPTPLKALTDSMPEIQHAIRVCSWNLYGWTPNPADAKEAEKIRSGWITDNYPSVWPKKGEKSVPGLVKATASILAKARARKAQISEELRRADAGQLSQYPAASVRRILREWGMTV